MTKRAPALLLALASVACATTREKGPLVAVAPAGATDEAARPRRFALLVGIDHFEDSKLSPLRYAAADASALAKALEGFDEVTVLARPEQTTRAALLAALDALARKAQGPRDTVLLYFSSHGSLGQKPGRPLSRYLVASDTRLDRLAETGLAVDELVRSLDTLRARRAALVLATCHSGKGKSQLDDGFAAALARMKSPFATPPLEERSEATIVLTAAAFGETARESDELGHDVYTHFLLEGVREGDRDGDGAVTISEAHDWARDRTYAFTGGQQRPTSESELLGKDPIVLRGRVLQSGKPVLFSYARSAEKVAVRVDGQSKGVLPGSIVLEEGAHAVQLEDVDSGATLFRGEVALARGDRLDVAELVPAPASPYLLLEGAGTSAVGAPSSLLPAWYSGAARLGVDRWPHRSVRPWIRLAYGGASGTEAAFGQSLPFRVAATELELGAAVPIELGRGWILAPGAHLGALWATKKVEAPGFTHDESMRGAAAGIELQLQRRLIEHLTANAQVRTGALWARLGEDHGPHAILSGGIGVAWSP